MTPNALEQSARELLSLYSEAELEMIRKLRLRLFRGADASDWAQRKLAEVQAMRAEMSRTVQALEKSAGSIRGRLLTEGYNLGSATLAQELRALGLVDTLPTPDARLERLNLIIADMDRRMDLSHTYILRAAEDGYRRVIGDSVQLATLGVETTRQATQRALDQFAQRGITGFWDKTGRRWGMAEYAEMAARTGMMRASLEGYTAQALAYGQDLVIITDHADECPLCRPWENRVLSLTGAQRNHPDCTGTMDEARAAGLFHPNCLHSFSVHVPGMTPLAGGDRQTATQSAVGYQRRQQQRYMERQVRAWKRRQAAAQAPYNQRVAKAHVDRWQAKLRDLTGDTRLPRKYNREGGRVLLSKAAKLLTPVTISEKGRIIIVDAAAVVKEAKRKGGRHNGKYLDAQSWSDSSLRKAAKSYAGQVDEHRAKLNDPAAYDAGWGLKNDIEKAGLTEKWRKDMRKNAELQAVIEQVLRERGLLK